MKRLKLKEALGLISAKSSPAISIYLGTNVSGRDSHRTLADNLHKLYQSTEAVIKQKYQGKVARPLLDGLKQALRSIRLRRSRGGIALFHSEGFTGLLKLPTPVKDLTVTADSFHLKPVLKASQLRRSFYLLAFESDSGHFYKVSADKITKLESANVLSSYAHGTIGESPPSAKSRIRGTDNLEMSLEDLNRKLELHCSLERLPLLLAGSVYHQNLFRSMSAYPYIVEGGMSGDISQHNQRSLWYMSSIFMEQYFAAFDDQVLKRFEQAEMKGHTTSRLGIIASAAVRGNVKHLLIAEDRHIWGRFDRSTGKLRLVTEHDKAGTDDVLDDIAEVTLLKQGEVTVLPSILMPEGQPIAAILKGAAHMNFARQEITGYLPAPILSHSIRVAA